MKADVLLADATPARFLDNHSTAFAFQRRVFEEATDDRNPLLERVRFLAILGANLARPHAHRHVTGAACRLQRDAETYLAARLCPELAREGILVAPALTPSNLTRLWQVSEIDRPDLQNPPLVPRNPLRAWAGDIFAALRTTDVLLHHPYDSFDPVLELLRQGAADVDVTDVAVTIYRTDHDSPVCHALLEAAERGKRVLAVFEPRARHDERNNAEWAAALHRAGARVAYGLGLKVHAKMASIVRREGSRTRGYVHVSSGNYHHATSRAYTDLALLTCDPRIATDVGRLLGMLAGSDAPVAFSSVLVSPFDLSGRLRGLIQREIDWTRSGSPGHIIMKMNALTDRDLIHQLYRASQAGVRIDLIVRGACRLRPGVAGVSERIHVRNIVGRFLEHSRAWYFRNGGADDVYIGSADLRPRNLVRRIEAMAPVLDAELRRRIRYGILGVYLADDVNARGLRSDGAYARVATPGDSQLSSQRVFLEEARA